MPFDAFHSKIILMMRQQFGGAATMFSLFLLPLADAWMSQLSRMRYQQSLHALSGKYLEDDLVAVQLSSKDDARPRLCVVRPDATVSPLCQHEDDVETDLFLDPRCESDPLWGEATDDSVRGTYGEGWYGQRPVPSLGGGPGYGAEAQEIWSVDETILEQLVKDGVDLPVLDVGIAHGEKARSGSF